MLYRCGDVSKGMDEETARQYEQVTDVTHVPLEMRFDLCLRFNVDEYGIVINWFKKRMKRKRACCVEEA